MNRTVALLSACLFALTTSTATAGPLRADHPLIGSWKITLVNGACHEVYQIKADGTTLVTSAEEVAQSEFELSDQPSAEGFFKWVDTIVKDNGKKDCLGEVMALGHTSTNYIKLHPSGKMFLMCEKEDINTCIGPFVRVKGDKV